LFSYYAVFVAPSLFIAMPTFVFGFILFFLSVFALFFFLVTEGRTLKLWVSRRRNDGTDGDDGGISWEDCPIPDLPPGITLLPDGIDDPKDFKPTPEPVEA